MSGKVIINGAYQTKFGELWDRGLEDLVVEAGKGAMKDGGVKPQEIDLVVVGNKLAGKIAEQDHLGCLAAELLGIKTTGIRVEAACASGGLAVHQAVQALRSGEAKTVLVIGVEKMTDKSNGEIAAALMGAASQEERQAGLSFVGLYALMARAYLEKFGATRKDLAYVAVKNHRHGLLNPKAQFRSKIDIDRVMNSTIVA
jgi:acetyl-CoA C-acetyltransferase